MERLRCSWARRGGIVLLAFAIAAIAYAQVATTGAISGTVMDSTGVSLPGATVTIINQGTGVSRTVTGDSVGFYSAESIPAGTYTVKVAKEGFKESVVHDMQIDPGMRRANDVKLQIGTASAQVTTTANTVQVNTETSESSGTVTAAQVSNLMLNGRNFQTLAIQIPGVSSTAGASELSGGGINGSTTLIVNGQGIEYTTYNIDGVYDVNTGNLANINILPIVDGIAEFRVLKDNYSAQYGMAGAGEVLVETKSGTDTFHGSAWDYLRNDAFDAYSYFALTKPSLRQNIYGYTLGGPVIIPKIYNTNRDKKTFFFAANQWYSIRAGQVVRGALFPQAMRNGNFSSSPTLNGNLSFRDANSQALLASEGKTNCILRSNNAEYRLL